MKRAVHLDTLINLGVDSGRRALTPTSVTPSRTQLAGSWRGALSRGQTQDEEPLLSGSWSAETSANAFFSTLACVPGRGGRRD